MLVRAVKCIVCAVRCWWLCGNNQGAGAGAGGSGAALLRRNQSSGPVASIALDAFVSGSSPTPPPAVPRSQSGDSDARAGVDAHTDLFLPVIKDTLKRLPFLSFMTQPHLHTALEK